MQALVIVAGVLILVALMALLNAAVFYFAWNLAVVPIFHAPEVTLLQAWLLGVLFNLIFQRGGSKK